MQISYHSVLTKIQKLQNFKKKKKNIFLYQLVLPKIDQYGRYLNRYETLMFQYWYTYRYGIDYLACDHFCDYLSQYNYDVYSLFRLFESPLQKHKRPISR